ncbi:hypothetical protein OROMI_001257 [Orobanche minor]
MGKIYNITDWAKLHLGGDIPLLNLAVQDVADAFTTFHPGTAWKCLDKFFTGYHLEDFKVSDVSRDYRILASYLLMCGTFEKKGHVGVRCLIHSEEAGAQLVKENNGTFLVGNGNIPNPVEEAGWRKMLKRVDEGGRSSGHDVPYTFGIIDHYSFHDNVRWDAWGRFAKKCTAYQPWIWTATNHEIDFAPEIGEYKPFKLYKHRYHVPYRASSNTLIPMSVQLSGLNLSHPLTDQRLASGSSLVQSFQQA